MRISNTEVTETEVNEMVDAICLSFDCENEEE